MFLVVCSPARAPPDRRGAGSARGYGGHDGRGGGAPAGITPIIPYRYALDVGEMTNRGPIRIVITNRHAEIALTRWGRAARRGDAARGRRQFRSENRRPTAVRLRHTRPTVKRLTTVRIGARLVVGRRAFGPYSRLKTARGFAPRYDSIL